MKWNTPFGLFAITGVLAVFNLNCGGNKLPDYVRLEGLRVLGIQAEPPEVSPGGTTSLSVLISDINGGGRALTFTLEGCTDPGIAYGAEPSCAAAVDRAVLANGSVSGLSAPNYTAVVGGLPAITVPATLLSARNALEQFNGVAYLLTYELKAADGTSLRSFKRVLVSTRVPKNSNPKFNTNGILADGSPLNALPSAKRILTASYDPVDVPGYSEIVVSGDLASRQEILTTTWFFSDGDFKRYRTAGTDGNEWTPPSSRPTGGRSILVVAVIRDGRGGEGFFLSAL